MATITAERLDELHRRRESGEDIHALAGEAGLSWQRLVMKFRYGTGVGHGPLAPTAGLLERFRPTRLSQIVGQPAAMQRLTGFARRPYPECFLFRGGTGTGKTSAAVALAGALGVDLSQRPEEFGGLHTIASGEQTSDTVRELFDQLASIPFSGSGWRVAIVNEADRMHGQAEMIWLDRLERLPVRTVIAFTTNYPEKLSERLRDRAVAIRFEDDAAALRPAAGLLAARVWRRETGRILGRRAIDGILERSTLEGRLSFRRVIRQIETLLSERNG